MLSTVGHIEHIAMVKVPAGSGLPNRTRPSGSHASGDTGRSIWMIGSKQLAKKLRESEHEPERRADEERERVALGDADERVPGEAQDALVELAALLERLERRRACSPPRSSQGMEACRPTSRSRAAQSSDHGGEAEHAARARSGRCDRTFPFSLRVSSSSSPFQPLRLFTANPAA